MSANLLESRISLISRKDIRWEGILVQVDRENASVTLQNVKSWGTEGRLPGDQQIPPSDHIHLCVNFRGEDIKDLHVHETAEASAPPPPPPPPPAPPVVPAAVANPAATVATATRVAPDIAAGGGGAAGAVAAEAKEAGNGHDAGAAAAAAAAAGEEDAAPGSSTMRDQGLKPGRYQPPHKNPNWKPPPNVQRGPPGPGSGAGSGTGALPGQGNHLLNRRTRGVGGGAPLDEEGEFDFQAGLAKFDKEKEMALLAGGISTASIHDSLNNNSNNYSGLPDSSSAIPLNGNANGLLSAGEGTEGGSGTGGEITFGADGGGGGGGGGGADGASAAAVAAVAAASASRAGFPGDTRSAADGGGEIWVEPPVVVKKYNKSSFFDEISCDALDGRGHMPGGRGGERTRNTETFGATSVALAAGSRRYGGRGGGGGYSGYSGGRRGGGYNNDRQGGGDNSYRGQYPQGGGGGNGGGGGGRGGNRYESSGNWRRN